MLKLDVILTTFHTSVKRRKITFNSYNYNFRLFILSPKYFLLYSLKITLPVNNVSRIFTMTCERRRHNVQKSRWRRDGIGQLTTRRLIGMNTVN